MKKLTLFLLVCLVLQTACSGGRTPSSAPDLAPASTGSNKVIAEGKLIPKLSVELAFAQPGVVKEVLAEPGHSVSTGQVIARLQNIEAMQAEVVRAEEACLLAEQAFGRAEGEALSAVAAANEAVRVAQYEFDNFDIPSDLRGLTTNEALEYTFIKLDEAREAFEPYKYLEERLERELRQERPDKPKVYRSTAKIYKKRMDDARAAYNKAIQRAEVEANLEKARKERELAQTELDRLLAGESAGEISVARAQYENTYANLVAARAALASYELRASFDGTFLRLDISVGETVLPGAPVAFIADTGAWQIETTDLTEIDIARVAIGDPATVQLDAFPGETFIGSVAAIDPVGRESLGDITYQVTVQLDAPDERFKWNMTAIVTIETK